MGPAMQQLSPEKITGGSMAVVSPNSIPPAGFQIGGNDEPPLPIAAKEHLKEQLSGIPVKQEEVDPVNG